MDCSKSSMMHKHHIIPRYMGGTDEETNLVEVTITQHAMYHFCNYQLWGNVEDYVAWRGLSGQISEAEFLVEKLKVFSSKGIEVWKKKFDDDEYRKEWSIQCKNRFNNSPKREEVIISLKINQPKAVEASKTPEARKRQKQKLKEIKHQQGEKNSQYRTIWIYNLELRECKKIYKNQKVLDGWNIGRIIDFDAYLEKEKEKNNKKLQREIELKNKINYYSELYEIYVSKGFQYIKMELNYDKTQENLIMLFRKYVSNYVPYQSIKKT